VVQGLFFVVKSSENHQFVFGNEHGAEIDPPFKHFCIVIAFPVLILVQNHNFVCDVVIV